MEICRVAFIGHRTINASYTHERKLEDIVKKMLHNKKYVEFYLGRNGDFDILAASVIKCAQSSLGHENSSLILVQPYAMKDDVYFEKFYDEISYPISNKTHHKAAITERNKWMIDNADFLIAYVELNRNGGAMTTLKYAQKKGLKIINLAN